MSSSIVVSVVFVLFFVGFVYLLSKFGNRNKNATSNNQHQKISSAKATSLPEGAEQEKYASISEHISKVMLTAVEPNKTLMENLTEDETLSYYAFELGLLEFAALNYLQSTDTDSNWENLDKLAMYHGNIGHFESPMLAIGTWTEMIMNNTHTTERELGFEALSTLYNSDGGKRNFPVASGWLLGQALGREGFF